MQFGNRKFHSTQCPYKTGKKNTYICFIDVDTTSIDDQGEGSAVFCVLEKTTQTSTEGSDEVGNIKKKGMKQTALTQCKVFVELF